MRMLPARSLTPSPTLSKKRASSKLKHLSAPLKGLSLSSKLTEGDPLTAPILDNFIVEEDRIACRAGPLLRYTHPAGLPIWCLIPYYGGINRLAGASNGEICPAQRHGRQGRLHLQRLALDVVLATCRLANTRSWSTARTASGRGTAATPAPRRRRCR